MNNWTDVQTQLPDSDTRYLASYDGKVFIAKYIKSANRWERDGGGMGASEIVSYWMVLPEPPKK